MRTWIRFEMLTATWIKRSSNSHWTSTNPLCSLGFVSFLEVVLCIANGGSLDTSVMVGNMQVWLEKKIPGTKIFF